MAYCPKCYQIPCCCKPGEDRRSDEAAGSAAVRDALKERARQDQKWGEQNHHPYKWLAILGEEFGESSKAVLEDAPEEYREEMVQVAAVALAAIESFDRSKWAKS